MAEGAFLMSNMQLDDIQKVQLSAAIQAHFAK